MNSNGNGFDKKLFTLLIKCYLSRSLVKSIGLFALGIRIAQECVGMELLPSQS